MPLEVVNITSEHIEAFPGRPARTAPTGQRPRTVRLSPTVLRLDEMHFTFNELNFARGYEYVVVLNEAYEIARSKLEGRR